MSNEKDEDDYAWQKLAKAFHAVEAWMVSYDGDPEDAKAQQKGRDTRSAIVSNLIGIILTENVHQMPKSEAVSYIGYTEDDRAVPILLNCLKDDGALVRHKAALSLARLAPVLLNQIAVVLRELETVQMDSVGYVRESAIFARKYIVNHAHQVAERQKADSESKGESSDPPEK